MQISNRIRPEVIQAAAGLLLPFVPEISATGLVSALKAYNAGETREKQKDKPYTRQEVADLLGLSVQTINRMMNAGTLRRLHVGKRAVRIDPQTVRDLLEGRTEVVQ